MTLVFDPARYPGERPDGPLLVHDGRTSHLLLDGPAGVPVRVRSDDPGTGAEVLAPGRVRWCVAYGSNASPARLVEKGLDRRGAVLLPARMSGWVPAFEARRTGYGSVPLTLVPAAGVVTDTWVLGLDADDVDRLDRSEGRRRDDRWQGPGAMPHDGRVAPPGAYELGTVGDVAVADRFLLRDALAYLPGPSTRIQVLADGWRTWPEHDQVAARAHVDGPGPGAAPPRVDEPVTGAWPATPLSHLPLFVQGSMHPGSPAWARIGALVEIVGEATAMDVHGSLLALRDRDSAAALFARAGTPGDASGLAIGAATRVRVGSQERWAVPCTWTDGHPTCPPS